MCERKADGKDGEGREGLGGGKLKNLSERKL